MAQARRLVEAVAQSARIEPSVEPLTAALLADAERGIARTFDRRNGGFGRAPKFPPSSTLEFLLRRGSPEAMEMVEATLTAMAAGGMFDLVGGGFHRYSVDDRWLVPHFEKMLYDNALLAPAYLHAWAVTGAPLYRTVVEETLDYVVRELRLPEGGLASAQDADTNGVEGLTFTWTEDEGVPRGLLQPFEHGRSIVRGELAADLRAELFERRSQRPQPGLDDKVLASWNGLALAALAEAARRFERRDWLDAAREVGVFLLGPLSRDDGRLSRSWREGKVSGEGFLDDYANAAHGLLELHVATGEARWLEEARRLAVLAVELFNDPERGGFFLAPIGGHELVARTKGLDDNPIPSGNSMLAHVLLRLSRIWGDDELERQAVSVLRLAEPMVGRAPGAFGWMLCALDLWLAAPSEIAIIGSVESPVARAALAPFAPNTVAAVGPADGVPLLQGKALIDGQTAVYVCERFVCRAPATDPAGLG